MALFSLSFSCLLLLNFQLSHGAPAAVFLPGEAADSVLRRHKRYNTGVFEELLEGNLERECLEEACVLEEAREIFENDEKTMAFWVKYVDGNQCDSSPCLNQGTCHDHLGHYTCSCEAGFTGSDCEIGIERRCDVNNGGCMHFCETMDTFGAKCSCAMSYRLTEDGLNCEPETEFPCGRTALTPVDVFTRSLFDNINSTLQPNASNISTTSMPTSTPPTPVSTTASTPSTEEPPGGPSRKRLPLWSLEQSENPTNDPPTPRKRIVGGEVVIPGEIPWQVGLIQRNGGHLFCGGSILTERWVITAAHCLAEAPGPIAIRVGEHNIYLKDGTEKEHEVSEQHIHPRYNASVSLYNHDIALIYLKTPIEFSTTVRPICIGPRAFTEALVERASPATVSGWGRTRFLGSRSHSLQKVEVPYVDRTECKRSSSARITPVMFCAGYYNEEKDACQGDSGGPHTNSFHDTWFLTGIVSWGEECAKDGKYGVYTRLSLYYPWVKHVIGLPKHRLALDMEEPEPDP